jgi:hypothetical protein
MEYNAMYSVRALIASSLAYFSTLKMEVTCSSETLVDIQETTQRYYEPG